MVFLSYTIYGNVCWRDQGMKYMYLVHLGLTLDMLEFILENIEVSLSILFIKTEMCAGSWNTFMEDRDPFILESEYQACWEPSQYKDVVLPV